MPSMDDHALSERAIKAGGTSKFKGVCWDKTNKKWRADIRIYGKQTHLGRFDSEEAAACKYDEAESLV